MPADPNSYHGVETQLATMAVSSHFFIRFVPFCPLRNWWPVSLWSGKGLGRFSGGVLLGNMGTFLAEKWVKLESDVLYGSSPLLM